MNLKWFIWTDWTLMHCLLSSLQRKLYKKCIYADFLSTNPSDSGHHYFWQDHHKVLIIIIHIHTDISKSIMCYCWLLPSLLSLISNFCINLQSSLHRELRLNLLSSDEASKEVLMAVYHLLLSLIFVPRNDDTSKMSTWISPSASLILSYVC